MNRVNVAESRSSIRVEQVVQAPARLTSQPPPRLWLLRMAGLQLRNTEIKPSAHSLVAQMYWVSSV